ncbi:hypothetical protein BVRB_5g124520 [Beta vulgaris subsp. vulgaris]|nr:hypothetical protein BVRB_5g124520 [Beta vulgaris subsp. vulgaris]
MHSMFCCCFNQFPTCQLLQHRLLDIHGYHPVVKALHLLCQFH